MNKKNESLDIDIEKSIAIHFSNKKLKEIPKKLLLVNPCNSMVAINLSENSLTSIPKQFFNSFPNLVMLDFRLNKLTTILPEIEAMKQLKVLHLSSNALTSLPVTIGNLSKLELLSVASNNLSALPSTIKNLAATLFTLSINENSIKVLPEELTTLVNLKSLSIFHNPFTAIPSSFWMLEKLNELHLEWLRYCIPPLPILLRGLDSIPILNIVRSACKQKWLHKSKELTVVAFLQLFTMGEKEETAHFRRAIHTATAMNDLGVVEGLILHNPSLIDSVDESGNTPLRIALSKGNLNASRFLIRNKAKIKDDIVPNGSLLHLAIHILDFDLITSLINSGLDLNVLDKKGNTALHNLFMSFMTKPCSKESIAKLLMQNGAKPNKLNGDKWGIVHMAAKQKHGDALNAIVRINNFQREKGLETFDMNLLGGEENWTPLHIASIMGYFEIVRILIASDADIFARSRTGRTPRACCRTHLAVYKLLYRTERALVRSFIETSKKPDNVSKTDETADDSELKSTVLVPQAHNLVTFNSTVPIKKIAIETMNNIFKVANNSQHTPSCSIESYSTSKGEIQTNFFRRTTNPAICRGVTDRANVYFLKDARMQDVENNLKSDTAKLYEQFSSLRKVLGVKIKIREMNDTLERIAQKFTTIKTNFMKIEVIHFLTLFPRVNTLKLLIKIHSEMQTNYAVALELDSAIQAVAIMFQRKPTPKKHYRILKKVINLG